MEYEKESNEALENINDPVKLNMMLRAIMDRIEKLEKELGITLFEDVEKVPSYATGSHSDSGLTLGDFIKKEDK